MSCLIYAKNLDNIHAHAKLYEHFSKDDANFYSENLNFLAHEIQSLVKVVNSVSPEPITVTMHTININDELHWTCDLKFRNQTEEMDKQSFAQRAWNHTLNRQKDPEDKASNACLTIIETLLYMGTIKATGDTQISITENNIDIQYHPNIEKKQYIKIR